MADLLVLGETKSQAELEDRLGINRTRIGQFLRLINLPDETNDKIGGTPDSNEYQIRETMAGHIALILKITSASP